MDNLDKKIIVENFIKDISGELSDINTLMSFLKLDNEKDRDMIEEALSLFNKKIKKIKKCHKLKEVNKYISVKKIIKENEKTKRYQRDDY